jgi:hypothetical protein
MTDLSPAAQAVLNAFTEDNCLHDWKHNHYNIEALAAALRAAVEQSTYQDAWDGQFTSTEKILAIAAELERSTTENP